MFALKSVVDPGFLKRAPTYYLANFTPKNYSQMENKLSPWMGDTRSFCIHSMKFRNWLLQGTYGTVVILSEW